MTGRGAVFACLLAALAAVGPGCARSFGLEVRDCSAEELGFVDEGIAAAEGVADLLGPRLALRHPDEDVSYDEILEQLRGAREDDRIRCAEPLDGESDTCGITGYAHTGSREIVLNVGHCMWKDAFADHRAGLADPPLDDQTLAKSLAGADRDTFEALRRQARGRLLAPATPATHLVHEAAHLATGSRYPHTVRNAEKVADDPDFVVHAGLLTFDALYWQVWLPEARRIDEFYFDVK